MDVDETNAWLEELLGFRADGSRAMLGTCCDAGQRPSASEGEVGAPCLDVWGNMLTLPPCNLFVTLQKSLHREHFHGRHYPYDWLLPHSCTMLCFCGCVG